MSERQGQRQFAVRMEWGLRGAEAITQQADYAVVVDVLSFTTAVSVALDQGAEVFPYPWSDGSAEAFARRHGAVLAVSRARAITGGPKAAPTTPADGVTAQTGGATEPTHAATAQTAATEPAHGARPLVSLSPASVRAATGLGRIVLPSPNGSALVAALAPEGCPILAACLRNRTAVATWLVNQVRDSRRPPVIAVIAAGERWPDGTLRPAVEDLWGAGAVVDALESLGVAGLSPEAFAAAAAWQLIEPTVGAALASCTSGVELADAGFGTDVTIASELDASRCVPVLTGARFVNADVKAQARSARRTQWAPATSSPESST